jgi:glucokinase
MAPRRAIAVDLGGTQLRTAVIDETGHIERRHAVKTAASSGSKVIVAQLIEAVKAVGDVGKVEGVGLSSPGPLVAEEGLIVSITTLENFENVPVVKMMEAELPYRVKLENDAICAALGEWKMGAGRGVKSMVYMTVSTGIGGGIIADGRVVLGRKGLAGHIGHMTIIANGDRCGCGNLGCWEAYASGTNFTKRAIARAKVNATTSLGKNGAAIDARVIFETALAGDQLAQELVDEQARFLGIGITSLLHVVSPEVVVMGGGVSNGFTQLMPGITGYITDHAMPAFRSVPIIRAELADNSGLIGAAMGVFEAR